MLINVAESERALLFCSMKAFAVTTETKNALQKIARNDSCCHRQVLRYRGKRRKGRKERLP